MRNHFMCPHVAIVILNWNNGPDTLACLRSIRTLSYPNYSTILVDNGSTDNSVSLVRETFPDVTVIETGDNLGYSAGNNIGLKHGLEIGADYLCILNNDTVLSPSCLDEMVREMEQSPNIGIVGPRIFFFEPGDMIFSDGCTIDWGRGQVALRRTGITHKNYSKVDSESTSDDVDSLVGCCMLVKRQVLEDVGFLDPLYYLNFEDTDWCIRTHNAGYRIRLVSKATLWHKVSASLGQASAMNTYYMTRNALLFFGSHSGGWSRVCAITHILFRTMRSIASWSIKSKYRTRYQAKRNANVLALRDAFLGRYGKMGADVDAKCKQVER